MPACWTQGDLAARLTAEGGRNCTGNTLSQWRTGKREQMTESQRAAVILLLPKLEAEARVIRVNAMAEARAFAVRARAFRARQAAEEILARRRQAAREAAQLEERKRRLDEANRQKQEREEAARLERAERDRWQSVQSVDLELVAPHGLWAAGEDLLVDRRPLELRVRIRDHFGTCFVYPSCQYTCVSIILASHASDSTREPQIIVRFGRCASTPLATVGPHTRARRRHPAAAEWLIHRCRVRRPGPG
jgi:hypothetical protein